MHLGMHSLCGWQPFNLHAQLIPIMGNLKPFPLSFRFPVSLNVAMVTTRSVIPLVSILSQMPCSRKESICGVINRTASNLESCFRKEISAPSAQSSGGLPSIQMIAPFFRSITSFFSICKAALSFSLKLSRHFIDQSSKRFVKAPLEPGIGGDNQSSSGRTRLWKDLLPCHPPPIPLGESPAGIRR